MAVRIRLKRMGRKKRPSYRIVVADAREPRDGKTLDSLGWYDPLASGRTYQVDEEKALRWLRRGAEPTTTVRSILSQARILATLVAEKDEAELSRQ